MEDAALWGDDAEVRFAHAQLRRPRRVDESAYEDVRAAL
jgi:hypothetical protein